MSIFKKKIILILILIIPFQAVLAHSDYYYTKQYGNVRATILTGFHYEEINKVFIVGQLAEKLAEELNYNEPVFLYFRHNYVGDHSATEYHISYGRGKNDRLYTRGDDAWQEHDFLDEDAIVIRQIGKSFDITSTLKLLEYAIKNVSYIKSHQKLTEYQQWESRRYRFYSIDQKPINKQLDKKASALVNAALENKIYRPENFSEREFWTGCSYYWQNNQFYFFWRSRSYNREAGKTEIADKHLFTLDSLHLFKEIENLDYLIFDTDSSFYYTDQYQRKLSAKHIIKDVSHYFGPYNLRKIAYGKVSLSINKTILRRGEKVRTLLYLTHEDRLIQDLDELIEAEL